MVRQQNNAQPTVMIIFNPNSTGAGKDNAKAMQEKLQEAGCDVALQPTKHAGHAVALAKQFATQHKNGIVISSSGDGGYHEVINGVLTSEQPHVVTGVLPSGNANDHYHSVHRGNTVRRIQKNDYDETDVLKVTTRNWTRYAHSYAGLGMTPQIGKELTKATLNPLREAWLVVKNLVRVRPVKIEIGGVVQRYDNLVFSNTPRMSKYLTLSTKAAVDDGKFEITRVRAERPWKLLHHLFRATVNQIDDAPQATEYAFTVLRKTTMQLDGEVYDLPAHTKVRVVCEHKILRCIV